MKRMKNLLILLAVLVLVIAGIFISKSVKRHVESISTIDEVVLRIDPDNLSEVTWEYEDTTLDFVKNGDVWQDSADASWPMDQDKFADFLDNFKAVHASFVIEAVEDYSQYDLENPQCTLKFVTSEGTSTVTFGTYSTMDSKRYICVDGGDVYLIDKDLLDEISSDRDTFFLDDGIPELKTLVEYKSTGDAVVDIVYDKDGVYAYTEDFDYYMLEDGQHKALSSNNAVGFLKNITNMKFTDHVSYTASTDDLSVYGLDKPAITIDVQAQNSTDDKDAEPQEVNFTVTIGTVTEGTGEDDTTKVFVRLGDSEIIYQMSSDLYDSLCACSYNDLRPVSVLATDWDKVNNINVWLDEEKGYSIANTYRDTDNSENDLYGVDGEAVDITEIKTAIDAMNIKDFEVQDVQAGVLEYHFSLDMDNADYPKLEIECYRVDGDSVLVKFNGVTLGLMDRQLMTDMRNASDKLILNLGK